MKWLFAFKWMNVKLVIIISFSFFLVRKHFTGRINKSERWKHKNLKSTRNTNSYCNVNRRGKPSSYIFVHILCACCKSVCTVVTWMNTLRFIELFTKLKSMIWHNISQYWSIFKHLNYTYQCTNADTHKHIASTLIHSIQSNIWIIVVKFEQNIDFKARKRGVRKIMQWRYQIKKKSSNTSSFMIVFQ